MPLLPSSPITPQPRKSQEYVSAAGSDHIGAGYLDLKMPITNEQKRRSTEPCLEAILDAADASSLLRHAIESVLEGSTSRCQYARTEDDFVANVKMVHVHQIVIRSGCAMISKEAGVNEHTFFANDGTQS